MNKIMILTDSGCDIPEGLLTDNIKVIPLTIYLDQTEFFMDEKTDKESFSDYLNLGLRPLAVQLEKKSILNVLNEIGEEYNQIIMITSSYMIYPNHEIIIKEAILDYSLKHLSSSIVVIDSNTTSMALGFLVLDAARLAKNGEDFDSIVNYVNKNKNKYRFDLLANDISCLKEHEVISSRKAKYVENEEKSYLFSLSMFGSLRPVLGKIDSDEVKETMLKRIYHNYLGYCAIVSSYYNRDLAYFYGRLASKSNSNPIISTFSCSNTCLMGTDSIGLCYKKK